MTVIGLGVTIPIAIERSSRALGVRIDETNRRIDNLGAETNQRFDELRRDNADLRERMARLEGSLDGFLAGRRDRDAA